MPNNASSKKFKGGRWKKRVVMWPRGYTPTLSLLADAADLVLLALACAHSGMAGQPLRGCER
eukprot:32579-Karenia_brevis.AAC.1